MSLVLDSHEYTKVKEFCLIFLTSLEFGLKFDCFSWEHVNRAWELLESREVGGFSMSICGKVVRTGRFHAKTPKIRCTFKHQMVVLDLVRITLLF